MVPKRCLGCPLLYENKTPRILGIVVNGMCQAARLTPRADDMLLTERQRFGAAALARDHLSKDENHVRPLWDMSLSFFSPSANEARCMYPSTTSEHLDCAFPFREIACYQLVIDDYGKVRPRRLLQWKPSNQGYVRATWRLDELADRRGTT